MKYVLLATVLAVALVSGVLSSSAQVPNVIDGTTYDVSVDETVNSASPNTITISVTNGGKLNTNGHQLIINSASALAGTNSVVRVNLGSTVDLSNAIINNGGGSNNPSLSVISDNTLVTADNQ